MLDTVKDTFGNLLQLLTNLKNKKIEFDFHKKINYGLPFGIIFITSNSDNPIDIDNKTKNLWHGYSKIPQEKRIAKIKEQMNEEIKINPSFCNYRVDSEQNRKINEIAEGLKSGKIIGKKIISNAFDLNASYCFITLDGLKNLKERLFIDIINVINQKKRVALNHAQIDDIQYNVLDSAFYFIFDVGNPSHLAIKVPRKSLENDELPNTKKNIFNELIKTIYGCIDDENAFLELENDKTINGLNHQDLCEKLKTQAFPLSDIITNAINQKEGVALDYALINDIKHNLLDNTFHFIFDIGNSLLKESSQLVVEVPREALDLENVDELVKSILLLNNNLKSHVSEGKLLPNNNLKCYISEGSYIIDLHLIDD
ncbi:hypothetical protein [Helicobacter pylori]|uniref:hypothetical protein n=1 Tax=Helicobacter pylori TaxID=210 RepID=UPI001E28567E|nr:hypothetical protein [Helicobacter pylori]